MNQDISMSLVKTPESYYLFHVAPGLMIEVCVSFHVRVRVAKMGWGVGVYLITYLNK